MKSFLTTLVLLLATSVTFGEDSPRQKIINHLQDISVTVKAGTGFSGESQGSGSLVTVKRGDDTLTFVWTAAHVVDSLRKTRPMIDPSSGTPRISVEFGDAAIVQEFRQDGRRIGEIKMDAKVIRYSDAQNGEDLALLQVRKKNFTTTDTTTKFYLDSAIPEVGTPLFHVGSLLGQVGSNSLTTGVISQQGRVLKLGANGVIFDQTTATAFPGSSGGGVYTQENGDYVGMLVRGAGEGFNFIVPIRRLHGWAKKANVEWAVNAAVPVPSDEELAKLPIEDSGVTFKPQADAKSPAAVDPGHGGGEDDESSINKAYPYLIRKTQYGPAVEAAKPSISKSLIEALLTK